MSKTLTKPETKRTLARPRFHPFLTFRNEMDELLSQLFGSGDGSAIERMYPSMDVSESDTSIEVKLDVPGIDPDDIDIQLNAGMLTIKGNRSEETEEKGKTFHRVERRYGSFSRSVQLPCPVNENEVAAEYRDGELMVTLPKSEEACGRRITVKH